MQRFSIKTIRDGQGSRRSDFGLIREHFQGETQGSLNGEDLPLHIDLPYAVLQFSDSTAKF